MSTALLSAFSRSSPGSEEQVDSGDGLSLASSGSGKSVQRTHSSASSFLPLPSCTWIWRPQLGNSPWWLQCCMLPRPPPPSPRTLCQDWWLGLPRVQGGAGVVLRQAQSPVSLRASGALAPSLPSAKLGQCEGSTQKHKEAETGTLEPSAEGQSPEPRGRAQQLPAGKRPDVEEGRARKSHPS